MAKYFAFWKRGWWAWLMMLCANVVFGLLVTPSTFAFGTRSAAYWVTSTAALIVIGIPVAGWLFERFAASSSRLLASQSNDAVV